MAQSLNPDGACQSVVNQQAPANWRWLGRAVKLVGGTTVTLPDTPKNQIKYPQQSNQNPGLGFPIARIIAQLQARGADVLFQQHQKRHTDFRKGRRLRARDHVVAWTKPKICPGWLSREQYDAFPDTLLVREIKVKSKVLVTTLLCATQAPKQAIGDLFTSRWNIELDLRNIKTPLDMEHLHCKTPTMNEKAFWTGLLAYNLIRLLMAESAKQADVLPRLLSFKHSLQLWQA